MSPPPDIDAPDAAAEAASQEIRNQLQWRINACAHPSRLINQIAVADLRCGEGAQALSHLIGRSPKVLSVIRAELRKAFEIDPDSLLFTEPKPPAAPQKIDTLTDRALLFLVRPSVVINLNQFTALSVKGDSGRRLPYTPLEVMQRVIAMNLWDRLARATSKYWDTLAEGSWLTRRERWVELHTQMFADRAFVARQLDELSSVGTVMVNAVIDAPTTQARERAGGDWAKVQVSQLMWPGTPAVAIPGALHIYREGEPADVPHVIYLPGVVRNFYEYPNFTALQCGLLALGSTRFQDLWQCLPLDRRNALCRPADLAQAVGFARGPRVTGDALAMGAEALLSGQWSNELACAVKINQAHVFSTERPRPQPLDAVRFLAHVEAARKQLVGSARLGLIRDQLLKWDYQRRSADIVFASMAPGLALLTLEHQVERYEKGLVALLAPDDLSVLTPAYSEVLSLMSQLKVHANTLKRMMADALQRSLDLVFWAERPGGTGTPRRVSLFMAAQTEALRCEVQMQHRLKLLGTAHRDLMIEVLEQPLASRRSGSETRVLSIAVGSEPDAFYPLHNVWVVTTAAAVRVPTRHHPVIVYASGVEGGVLAFSGLQALTKGIKASLSSRDDSVLWGCIERDKRRDLRVHATHQTLGVRYVDIKGKPALASLKKLLGTYHRLYTSREDITRIFSEVKDVQFSRALLMLELEDRLRVPLNNALSQAQANVELLRKTAAQAKNLPAWLVNATRAQRKKFRRSQRLYLSGAFAFVSRLEQRLPDFGTFARDALVARLSRDAIPAQWAIDLPFIEMPDDVHDRFCGWESVCAPGDRNRLLTPTAERTTFSLMQLALHNLDPLAPWTKWRLNRARYLQPDWKQRLNADYLISMVSTLDLGGQYDALINSVFFARPHTDQTPSESRVPELWNRTLKAGFKHHLFSANQQGLSAGARSVFKTAMAARTPPDLLKYQHQLQLYVLHLVGHTMQHDRYIAGIMVVQDKCTGLCVVYWPEAPHALVLTEYASLQQAHDQLNRLGALPENVKALARQVAPGWAFEAITHPANSVSPSGGASGPLDVIGMSIVNGVWRAREFIRSFNIKHLEPAARLDEIEKVIIEQIASEPLNWLALVATRHSNAQALLYRAAVLDLQRRTQEASRSGKELEKYRLRRLSEDSDSRNRRIVGFFSQFFFPLFALLNDAYELLLVARQYHRFGDPRDAVDVGFMTSFLAIDLLLNFIPGPGKLGAGVARGVRSAPRAALGRLHRLRMMPQGANPRLALPRVIQMKALDRLKIKGVPEGAVALKGPGDRGVYVKGGELFVSDGTHIYPVYRRNNEQSFRLKNQQVPGQDELILNIHQPGEWLLGADAAQPVAGTSSGVLNPWRLPVPSPADWRPPSVRIATQNRILQSTTTATHWAGWRIQDPMTSPLASVAPGIFNVPADARGLSYQALRVAPPSINSGYYMLLPQGDQAPLNGIVFIKQYGPAAPLADVDLYHWTSVGMGDQPIPVSRTLMNDWALHAPLFDRTLMDYVAEVFPTMTRQSRFSTVARLVELSGPPGPATATHLLNIRATLDNWLSAPPVMFAQADDLLRMLKPIERRSGKTFIGFNGRLGFIRVDFEVRGLDPSLWLNGAGIAVARDGAQRVAVREVLTQQGFDVREVTVKRGGILKHELIAIHPMNPSNVYYVSLQWLEAGSFTLNSRLKDHWIETAIKQPANVVASAGARKAMKEGRLVRIIAGIQWPVSGNVEPSVYFVKVSPTGP